MNEKEKVLTEVQAEPTITKQTLLTELRTAIEDLFVATIKEENGELRLQFFNGQRFALTVKEL